MRIARILFGTILFVLIAELAQDAGFSLLSSYGFALLGTFLAHAMVFTAEAER